MRDQHKIIMNGVKFTLGQVFGFICLLIGLKKSKRNEIVKIKPFFDF